MKTQPKQNNHDHKYKARSIINALVQITKRKTANNMPKTTTPIKTQTKDTYN